MDFIFEKNIYILLNQLKLNCHIPFQSDEKNVK
jgi:hypothetical protein